MNPVPLPSIVSPAGSVMVGRTPDERQMSAIAGEPHDNCGGPPSLRTMVSAPGLLLAQSIAWRRVVPWLLSRIPPSPELSTLMPAALAGLTITPTITNATAVKNGLRLIANCLPAAYELHRGSSPPQPQQRAQCKSFGTQRSLPKARLAEKLTGPTESPRPDAPNRRRPPTQPEHQAERCRKLGVISLPRGRQGGSQTRHRARRYAKVKVRDLTAANGKGPIARASIKAARH